MAAMPKPVWNDPPRAAPTPLPTAPKPAHSRVIPEFSGVFRGHELTRKDRRLACDIAPLDALLGGGIARGRVSEIIGRPGSGRTSLAASFAASALRRGEVAAWLETSGAFDPASFAAAGIEPALILWASIPPAAAPRQGRVLKAAEMVLAAGGFGLVVVDFGDAARAVPQAAALRLARAAERSGAAVIVIAPHRMCGTFAALSLVTHRARPVFGRLTPRSPALFDALAIEIEVARNKLGGRGGRARLGAVIDPYQWPSGQWSRESTPAARLCNR
jgi:recA bacterial DNA recombination protein